VSQDSAAIGCQWFEQVWNQRRLDVIGLLATPDCRSHGHVPHDGVIGLDEFREFARGVQAAFPDLHVTVEETISEGDRVVLRWVARGTHRGSFLGASPTGKDILVRGITLLRLSEGKIVEAWDNWDQMGLLAAIGILPPDISAVPAAKAG
jgi:steroid delta-isomerase-like uncharacterized protein